MNTNTVVATTTWAKAFDGPLDSLYVQPSTAACEVFISDVDPTADETGILIYPEASRSIALVLGKSLYVRSRSGNVSVIFSPYIGTGVPSTTDNYGNMNIVIQDQFSDSVSIQFSEALATFTLAESLSIGDTSVTGSTTGVVPVAGNNLCLREGVRFYQGEILSVVANGGNSYTLTVDMPVDYAFTTSGGCTIANTNMAVDGSVTPRTFRVSPANLTLGTKWDITGITISMRSASPMDDSLFGALTALAKGVVARVRYNGVYKNLTPFSIKRNSDFSVLGPDWKPSDKAPSGEYGLSWDKKFNGQQFLGIVIRLTSDDDPDSIEVIVRDNLALNATMTSIRMVAHGHYVV